VFLEMADGGYSAPPGGGRLGLSPREVPRDGIEVLDAELLALARGSGALRLELGEALDALATPGGHHACGFSSLGAYSKERCGKSGRWAHESRALARRLRERPRLREALQRGELGWSMVELLARHLDARHCESDEATLLARARDCTVRQMREALRKPDSAQDAEGADDDAESEARRTLQITVPTEEAWLFECTRILIEQLEGGRASTERVMEILLAEGELTLQGMVDPIHRDGALLHELEREARGRHATEMRAMHDEAERRCEADFRVAPSQPQRPQTRGCAGASSGSDGAARPALPTDPARLDGLIRELAREQSQRELSLGQLAVRFFAAHGESRLGYASRTQYARERLGLSYSTLKSHMALARCTEYKPAIRKAMRAGRLGSQGAALVARVSSLSTTHAWLARASQRTVKHLEEEVRATELLQRALQRRDLPPPDDDTLEAVRSLQRDILSGRFYREALSSAPAPPASHGQMSAHAASGSEAVTGGDEHDDDHDRDGQMSAHPAADHDAPPPTRATGMRTRRLRVSEETFCAYRALEHDYLRRAHVPLGFVSFLCISVWQSWHAAFRTEVAYAGIYTRDLFRCSSPVCERRDVTPHHLRFRSHGGDDSAENLVSLCVWCHLDGIHGGRLTALPPASEIQWTLGTHAPLRIHGRTKLQPTC
jgi:hypothetical protein